MGRILHLFLGQEPLDPESLVRTHGEEESTAHTTTAVKKEALVAMLYFILSHIETWLSINFCLSD